MGRGRQKAKIIHLDILLIGKNSSSEYKEKEEKVSQNINSIKIQTTSNRGASLLPEVKTEKPNNNNP